MLSTITKSKLQKIFREKEATQDGKTMEAR